MRPNGDYPPVMKAASAGAAGKRGLVPKPAAGDEGKFLRGDKTWQASGTLSTASEAQELAASSTAVASTPGRVGLAVARVRNALAAAQGLAFDGTSGATLTNLPAFGTADFTIALWCRATAMPAFQELVAGGANAFIAYVTSTGVVAAKIGGSAVHLTSAAGVVESGKTHLLVFTRTAGTLTLYKNAVSAITAADALDYSAAITALGSGATLSTEPWAGYLRPCVWNRALSAAEVVTLYERNAPASADYNSASNTPSYVSDYSSSADNWSQESGSGAMGGNVDAIGGLDNWLQQTQGASAGPLGAYSASKVPRQGRYYRITGKIRHDSATVTSYRVFIYAQTSPGANGLFGIAVPANTTVSFDFYFPYAVNSATPFFVIKGEQDFAPGEHSWIREVNIYDLGLLCAPEANAPGNGYQLKDASRTTGPFADITLPVTGVTWALPDRRPNSVRGTLTWAGTHEAKSLIGQRALPDGAVPTLLTSKATVASSGSGKTIGTTNSATRWAAAATFTTAKKVDTLANQLPAGTADADNDIVVDPDTANYTGSIEVEAHYALTQPN